MNEKPDLTSKLIDTLGEEPDDPKLSQALKSSSKGSDDSPKHQNTSEKLDLSISDDRPGSDRLSVT